MFYIYMHKNKINNKVYIGQTKQQPEKRWGVNGNGYKTQMFYDAIQKYGWHNFEHCILETVETQEEANIKEAYFISQYKSTNPKYGYNIALGGNVAPQSLETRLKRSEALKGKNNPMYNKHWSKETKDKVGAFMRSEKNPNLKPVICINTKEIFKGSTFAAKKYNISNPSDIGQCCMGKRKHCGKALNGQYLQWQFYEEWLTCPKEIEHSKTAIICLNTLDIFETADSAAQWAGLKSSGGIRACCSKTGQKTAGHHPITKESLQWSWYKDYSLEIAENL